MKTTIRLLALLAVVCLIFCGCSVEDKTITVDNMTMSVPGNYMDFSKEDYAAGYALVYGSQSGAVMVLKENRADFEAYGLADMTAMDYVELLEQGYQLTNITEQSNGMVTFQFDNQGNTYLAAVFADEDAFWLIQAGCPSDGFAKQEETFRNILNSVSFA